MDFGAYLQCHKNPYATYKCLESFRAHYPHSTVVLVSDNGYNYAKMAQHFGCIYIHSNENLLLIYKNLEGSSYIENSRRLMKRVSDAFELCKEEYVMWLEDDVSINQKIEDTFKYDINGFCPNFIVTHKIYEKYNIIDLKKIYRLSGHGGTVFRKRKLLESFLNEDVVMDVLTNWTNYGFPTDVCQDYLFSVLVTLNGGTVGPYEGHNDGQLHSVYYKNGTMIKNYVVQPEIRIQHQYKKWYGVPMPDDLKHLVENI